MIPTTLTDEQQAIAEADIGARLLVNAGPGTGKTHTLTARISHLVENQDLAPGAVLALSFSRAAVGVLRTRLKATEDSAARVLPVTFDSLATRVLAEIDPDGEWSDQSYDGRIAAATGQITAVAGYLENVKHVCVDEVQDLVGVRMLFVRELLAKLDVGFTVLGDLAQGIYDFQLEADQSPNEYGAPAFYSWIRERFAGSLTEHTLTINHRARGDAPKATFALGRSVVSEPESAARRLVAELAKAPEVSMSLLGRTRPGSTTAILCRNNGQAMLVSRELRELGIQHVLQRRATDRLIAPWVASLLNSGIGGLSRERFERLSGEWRKPPDPSLVWGPLRGFARGGRDSIDLDLLLRKLRTGVAPDELQMGQAAEVTVSTVHRAKGLEFDRVAVLASGWREPFDDEDAKTLFVALTRPRDSLLRLHPPDYIEKLTQNPRDRWVHRGWKRSQRHGFEIQLNDVYAVEPAGEAFGRQPGELQDYLRAEVQSGDAVTIEFDRMRFGSPATAVFRVVHNSTPIATMSDDFGAALGSELQFARKNWEWPQRMTGLAVESVHTAVGDPLVTSQMGLGPSGAWLAPAIAGLSRFVWKEQH